MSLPRLHRHESPTLLLERVRRAAGHLVESAREHGPNHPFTIRWANVLMAAADCTLDTFCESAAYELAVRGYERALFAGREWKRAHPSWVVRMARWAFKKGL